MKAVAAERRRFGCRRIHVMLKRQGIVMNLKKLRRIYREEKLQVRRRGGRKRALGTRRPMILPSAANQRWSLDFISDAFTPSQRMCHSPAGQRTGADFGSLRLSTTSRANAWRWSRTRRCRGPERRASWMQ